MHGIDQRAEVTDLLAESENLVDDTVNGAGEYQAVGDIFRRDCRVRHILVDLEQVAATAETDQLAY